MYRQFNRILRSTSADAGHAWVFPNRGLMMLASVLMSLVWVENYQYRYNVHAFNTYGINIWAFSLWILTGYFTLQILFFVKKRIKQVVLHLPVSWLVYFAGLLFFEYLGYYILNIREQRAQPGDALIFGVIHGTVGMHIYYVVFPVLISFTYKALSCLSHYTSRQVAGIRNAIVQNKYKTWP